MRNIRSGSVTLKRLILQPTFVNNIIHIFNKIFKKLISLKIKLYTDKINISNIYITYFFEHNTKIGSKLDM